MDDLLARFSDEPEVADGLCYDTLMALDQVLLPVLTEVTYLKCHTVT